jgi:sugar phosphate isomerase/epimerase
MLKIQAAGAAFSPCEDRFVVHGYRKGLTFPEMIDEFAKIDGINGIGMIHAGPDELEIITKKLKEYNMMVGCVCPDTYLRAEQKTGTISSRDPKLRRKYIDSIKASMDQAAELDAYDVLLWFAHDGFDYPFEDDYTVKWNWMLDALAEIVEHRNDVKVAIEYKAKEPRTRQHISTVGRTVAICEKIGKPNLGVVVDLGHSLAAGENPAEAVEFAALYGRLFDIHLNDNYRTWDDDLLLGSINFFETLEFFYSLRKLGYDEWYDIDIWPSRVDGRKALEESVARIRWFIELADKLLASNEFTQLRTEGKTMRVHEYLREILSK